MAPGPWKHKAKPPESTDLNIDKRMLSKWWKRRAWVGEAVGSKWCRARRGRSTKDEEDPHINCWWPAWLSNSYSFEAGYDKASLNPNKVDSCLKSSKPHRGKTPKFIPGHVTQAGMVRSRTTYSLCLWCRAKEKANMMFKKSRIYYTQKVICPCHFTST